MNVVRFDFVVHSSEIEHRFDQVHEMNHRHDRVQTNLMERLALTSLPPMIAAKANSNHAEP